MTKHFLLAFLVVGCKSDDKIIDLPPDAMPDSDTPAMNSIVIETFGDTPTFIMYRDGDRAWQAPTTISGGYELRVHDAYQLIAVCDSGGFYDTGLEASTYDESGGMTYLPCYSGSDDPGTTTVKVTGTMTQPGVVKIGGAESSGTATNWGFELDVETGLHDLVAVATTNKVLIRRDLNVSAAMSVPSVDATVAMTAVPYTLGNDADESVTTQMWLMTGHEFTMLPEHMGATAYVVPDTQLMPNDRQYAIAMASAGQTWRGVFARYTSGSSTTFTLLPRLSGVQFTANGASWSTLPEGDVDMYLSGDTAQVSVRASKAWLGTRTELAVDTSSIPGFNPAWFPSTTQYRGLTVSKDEGQVSLATGITSF